MNQTSQEGSLDLLSLASLPPKISGNKAAFPLLNYL